MTGQEYLENIKTQLEEGRRQNREGENVLRAFGYVRRRATAIGQINETLDSLGLVAVPPVSSDMPLRVPRIRFRLKAANKTGQPEPSDTLDDTLGQNEFASSFEDEDGDSDPPEPTFSVSELASANTLVECVSGSASIQTAYTIMLLKNYSQLVVADGATPMHQAIKGVVSFKSIAKALMNGKPTRVGDCIHKAPMVEFNTDLSSIVNHLSENDVVLVIGQNKKLQGIVTAWDLAEEFAELVDPFKRIGEIEARLRTLIRKRLGMPIVGNFLGDERLSGDDPVAELNELTMGDLQRVLEYPEHWEALQLAFDRTVFIDALNKVRLLRNRLMHFRDPLAKAEMTQLTAFCDTVREVKL